LAVAAALLAACGSSATESTRSTLPGGPGQPGVLDKSGAGRGGDSLSKAYPSGAPSCALAAIYFDFDSVEIKSGERDRLTANARCLENIGRGEITVTGMADPRGTEEYNLALGERRASATVRYLTQLGVEGVRLTHRSVGEEFAGGTDEKSWARDRRAEFSVR